MYLNIWAVPSRQRQLLKTVPSASIGGRQGCGPASGPHDATHRRDQFSPPPSPFSDGRNLLAGPSESPVRRGTGFKGVISRAAERIGKRIFMPMILAHCDGNAKRCLKAMVNLVADSPNSAVPIPPEDFKTAGGEESKKPTVIILVPVKMVYTPVT
ncbi:hypothetical protein OPV22_004388 [Ensete ventricosum]|uniref:Uncharacterized protein n=1 Tax=Ensete ventricosum TaxID=4639 RepID=A0AAV8S3N9_ENSVE|nr:hypothetical protein OPV22_004388 [Ensete ventricosum]